MSKLYLLLPMLFLAGLVDSIGGGGGLISLPAYLLSGLPPHTALGCNKFSSTAGTTASIVRFWRQGYIRRQFFFLIPFAFLGAFLGTKLTLHLSEQIFRWVLLAILPLTAFLTLRPPKSTPSKNSNKSDDLSQTAAAEEPLSLQQLVRAAGIAFAVGCYDGFYGPGTGTFLIVLLSSFAHFGLKSSLGCAKVLNYASNWVSLSLWLLNGKVLLPLTLYTALANIGGQLIGSRLVVTKGQAIVRPIILFVLLLLAGRVLYELLASAA